MLCWKFEDVHVSLEIFRLVQVLLDIKEEFGFLFVGFYHLLYQTWVYIRAIKRPLYSDSVYGGGI